jgi:hypothetical protein
MITRLVRCLTILAIVCGITAQKVTVHNPTKESVRLIQTRVAAEVGLVHDEAGDVIPHACTPLHGAWLLEFVGPLPAFAAKTFHALPPAGPAAGAGPLAGLPLGPPEAVATSPILVAGQPLDFARSRVLRHSPLRSITRVPITAPGLGGWMDIEWIPLASGTIPIHVWLIARPVGATSVTLPEITLETFGAVAPVWDHARRKGLAMTFGPGEYTRTVLTPAGRWGRFQGQLFHGHLAVGPGSSWLVDVPLYGSQLDVVVEGTALFAGPQPSPAALSAYLAGVAHSIGQSKGKPWSPPEPMGLRTTPGGTGGQPDFGERKLWWFPGQPRGVMRMASECISQELCRGVWHLELDGLTRVVAGAHPTWRVWDSTTHWNSGVSPDRLGCPGTWDEWSSTGGFWGWDLQHFSINFLLDYAEITGEHWALELIDWLCDTWLASLNDNAPRATGRQLYAMTRAWQLLGRADVRALCIQRARSQPTHIGASQASFGLIGPDARNLLVQQSVSWQDGMCGAGMAYCAEVFGLQDVKDKCWAVGKVWLENAWRDTGYSGGRLEVLKAMAWNGGVKLTEAQYAENKSTGAVPILDALIEDSRGTDFTNWNMAFVRWLLREAKVRLDPGIEALATRIIDEHRGLNTSVEQLAWWQLWAA